MPPATFVMPACSNRVAWHDNGNCCPGKFAAGIDVYRQWHHSEQPPRLHVEDSTTIPPGRLGQSLHHRNCNPVAGLTSQSSAGFAVDDRCGIDRDDATDPLGSGVWRLPGYLESPDIFPPIREIAMPGSGCGVRVTHSCHSSIVFSVTLGSTNKVCAVVLIKDRLNQRCDLGRPLRWLL